MSQYLDLNDDSKQEQLRHAEVLKQFEAQKRARTIVVPTAIEDVKARLRQLGHPVTLFAEGHVDRRERLREVIAKLELNEEELNTLQVVFPIVFSGYSYMSTNQTYMNKTAPSSGDKQHQQSGVSQEQMVKQKEVFYSAALESLQLVRKLLCPDTFQAAHERLLNTKRIREDEQLQAAEDKKALGLYTHCKDMNLNASQFGDERPLTAVRYSADGSMVASGSLGNSVKLWDSGSLTSLGVLRHHVDRVTAVAWHPQSSFSGDAPCLLASSSGDGSCNLYDCRPLLEGGEAGGDSAMDVETASSATKALRSRLTGHHGVVSSCAFHPMGRLLGTAGHDFSWRLWDVESGAELLLQDGHVKECSALAFHGDGSLCMTGDAGGVVLLWDLRSGQCVAPFQGHIKKISGVSFNCNGYQAATCSLDNTVKIWDLRKKKCSYTLPAHSNVLSDATFSRSGELLLTASFDGTIKIWGARDYRILRTLSGHGGKVMACDFSPDEQHVVSAGYDRTVKLWAHKDEF